MVRARRNSGLPAALANAAFAEAAALDGAGFGGPVGLAPGGLGGLGGGWRGGVVMAPAIECQVAKTPRLHGRDRHVLAPWRRGVGQPRFFAMLIDVHAHFYHDRTPRADWRERDASRPRAGERIGGTDHGASVLGPRGRPSPGYFPSPPDPVYRNGALAATP